MAEGGPGNLESHFQCPLCFDYVALPIIQCESGHLLCAGCRANVSACPFCRAPLLPGDSGIRNLALERMATALQVRFPCKFFDNGCQLRVTPEEKLDHEAMCQFKPIKYKCPFPKMNTNPRNCCNWAGELNEVMAHIRSDDHGFGPITSIRGEEVVFMATAVDFAGATHWIMEQSAFENRFLLMLQKEKVNGIQKYSAYVRFIGSGAGNQKFKYTLKLSSPGKQLTWEKETRSMDCFEVNSAAAAAMPDSENRLEFEESVAKLFIENRSLEIQVTIARNVD